MSNGARPNGLVDADQSELTIEIDANQNLVLMANDAARDCLREDSDQTDHGNVIYDLFEPYSTNGSYTLFDAGEGDPMVGLTSAPCIAESMIYGDDGMKTVDGRMWWYPDYAVSSYVDKLMATGRVVFQLGT